MFESLFSGLAASFSAGLDSSQVSFSFFQFFFAFLQDSIEANPGKKYDGSKHANYDTEAT